MIIGTGSLLSSDVPAHARPDGGRPATEYPAAP
jgi:hypothetical protein